MIDRDLLTKLTFPTESVRQTAIITSPVGLKAKKKKRKKPTQPKKIHLNFSFRWAA